MEEALSPKAMREKIRKNEWPGLTAGLTKGYVHAGVTILPRKEALDFMIFCQRNPQPFPVIDVTEEGSPEARISAPGSDLRTDLPQYRVYEKGIMTAEVTDVKEIWRSDFVGFVLGCSFSFEEALLQAGIPVRNLEEKKNVPIYVTNKQCVPSRMFQGPLAVSMRPIHGSRITDAIRITAKSPLTHGAPVHVGDPSVIGIKTLEHPDYGEALTINNGELPCFWACGVTLQVIASQAKPELMITQAPGHMFLTDIRNDQLAAY